ncbi:MAG: exonuclease SbcCD subunit D [Clostridiales bacterium]|nr:exonuclease SbcCD subunit D [Clostridiales bacterium]
MKILHTSDIHFGISLKEHPLIAEQKQVSEQILKAVKEQNADAIIIAGDVFDRAVTNARALSLYNDFITALHTAKIPVFIIAGNHDAPERLALLDKLLCKSDIYISGKLTAQIEPIELGNCHIYLIPYFNLDTAKSLYPDEVFASYQQAFSHVTKNIFKDLDKSKFNIAVSHCYAQGGQLSDSDRAAKLGQASIVSADVFKGFNYTALGHLHAPHFINDKKNIRYSGTPYPYSFGEKGGAKTLTLIDTENGKISEIPLKYTRNLRTIEGTYLEVLEKTRNDKNKDDYVRINIIDRYPEASLYETFKKEYEYLLSFDGMQLKDPTTVATLTAESIAKMEPKELLESFYNGREEQLGEFELEWFQKAIDTVMEGDDKQ